MSEYEEENSEYEIEETDSEIEGKEEETAEVAREAYIVPKASSVIVKEIARRPVMARAIFYLDKHGVCYATEIERAIGCNCATVHFYMQKLTDIGVVETLKQSEVEKSIDKRMTYYKLVAKQHPNWNAFKKQLKKLFEYELLRQLERLLPVYEWISIEQIRKDPRVNHIINREFGMNFDEALKTLLSFPVFYIQKEDNGEVSAIKRKYDNRGRRIDEKEPELLEVEPEIEEVAEEAVEFLSELPEEPEEVTVPEGLEEVV